MLDITALVAVKNEEANLRACLGALSKARSVFVVDSHSEDGTGEIARSMGAEVIQFSYRGGYPKKRQWALDTLPIQTEWVLLVDADEVVTESLWAEIERKLPDTSIDAYLITKDFHFLGKRLRFGGFSHAAVCLFRYGKGKFEELDAGLPNSQDMEVHERVLVNGRIAIAQAPLRHRDFKGLEAYLDRHNKYSTWDAGLRASFIQKGTWGTKAIPARLWGNTQERRRKLKELALLLPFEPQFWFLYHYIIRLGFLDGRRGLIAASMRGQYISNVRAKLHAIRMAKSAEEFD